MVCWAAASAKETISGGSHSLMNLTDTYRWIGSFWTIWPFRCHWDGIVCNFLYFFFRQLTEFVFCFYNNPSYSRILIGSRLWSIRGQMHDWCHQYKVFPSAVLEWRKVLRISIIFYVTGQKIRFKKVFPRHWTGSRSQKTKDKAVSFRKWYRNNFLAASVGSRARLNHAQTWSW